jgi:trimeric autotransporter adhesin
VPTSSTGSVLKGIGIDAAAGTPGASARLVNGVVTGSTRCLSVVDPETGSGRGNADTTNPPTLNSILFDCVNQPTTVAAGLITAGANNSTTTANTLGLAAAPATALTNFVNGSAETTRTAVDPTTLGSFFSAAPYIGAVRNNTDNWWRSWSCGLEATTC